MGATWLRLEADPWAMAILTDGTSRVMCPDCIEDLDPVDVKGFFLLEGRGERLTHRRIILEP